MAVRACAVCRKFFDAKSPRAKYCGGTCRTRASRAGQSGPVSAPVSGIPSVRVRGGALVDSVRAELSAAGRDDSPLGVAALELAAAVADPMTVANAKAGLVRELRATLAEALKGAAAASAVDELRARRARRFSG